MCVGQANTMADRLFCCKCLGAKFQSPLNGSMCGLPCSLSLALEPKTSPLSGVGGGKKKKKEQTETSSKILLHRPVHKFLTATLGDGQVSCLSEATSIISYLLVVLRFQLTPEPLVHIANTSRSWMCLNSPADSH